MIVTDLLLDGDLPGAELSAARLDGDLVALAGGYCPLDAVDSPGLRARAALAGRSTRLVIELGTASWVWGARASPPPVSEFALASGAHIRAPEAGVRVREVRFAREDITRLAGVRVTTALRCAVDLARVRERFDDEDAATVRALAALGGFGLRECRALLDRSTHLPDKRRAVSRLAGALSRR